MNALARIEEGQSLTEKQRAFVEAILKGKEPDEAQAIAGYSQSIFPTQILASPSVQRAIQAACDAELGGMVRVRALKAMKNMLGDETPAATRFQAAKWVLERGDKHQADDEKPLSEMTPDELMRFIQDAEKRLVEANTPRMIDVTPENGA